MSDETKNVTGVICFGILVLIIYSYLIIRFLVPMLVLTVILILLVICYYKGKDREKTIKIRDKAIEALDKVRPSASEARNKEIEKLYIEAVNTFNNKNYIDAIKLAKDVSEKLEAMDEKKRLGAEERRQKKQKKEQQEFKKKQLAKGLIEFKGRWGTPRQVKTWREIESGLNDNFSKISPYEFEEFVGKLFTKMGYRTTVTSKSKDYGIDVIAKGHGDIIAIQCKKHSDGINVGNRDIQRARGSMDFYRANKCIVLTNQDFTVEAREQARRTKNVELWNKNTLHRMVRRYFVDNP